MWGFLKYEKQENCYSVLLRYDTYYIEYNYGFRGSYVNSQHCSRNPYIYSASIFIGSINFWP